MAEDKTKTDPPKPPEGETDAEKTAREDEERRQNAAESKVKTWVKEALAEDRKTNQPSPTTGSQTPGAPKRKSMLDTILGH